jgi:hypothetical protein
MSATSAGNAFDLRCEVREQLIDFLHKEYPDALPRQRTDVTMVATPNAAATPARETAGKSR